MVSFIYLLMQLFATRKRDIGNGNEGREMGGGGMGGLGNVAFRHFNV